MLNRVNQIVRFKYCVAEITLIMRNKIYILI